MYNLDNNSNKARRPLRAAVMTLLAAVALVALASLLPPVGFAQESGVEFYVKQGVRSDGSGGRLVSANSLTISEGLSGYYFVKLQSQPSADVVVAPASPSSSVWVNTGHGGPLTFTSQNWDTVQSVQVFTYPEEDTDNDTVSISHTITSTDSNYNGLTRNFVFHIIDTWDECTASAAPTLTVGSSNRSMTISPAEASCPDTPIIGYDTAIKKDDASWQHRANTRAAFPSSWTYSVKPVVNTYEVFSGSTYLVKTRGITYNKGPSPWSPAAEITVSGVKASDASLLGLYTSPGELQFDTATTEYTVNVPRGETTSVTVVVSPRDFRATFTVDGKRRTDTEIGVEIPLVEGEDKVIPVVVTAEDGVTTKTYTVTVVQVSVTTEEEGEGEGANNSEPGGL